MELIDRAAVVAEIERRKKELIELNNDFANHWACGSLDNILTFINTLEVKEVDLEKEIDNYFNTSVRKNLLANDNVTLFMQYRKVAKHFFELGISVSNKSQKKE